MSYMLWSLCLKYQKMCVNKREKLYLANGPNVVSDIGYKRADVADLSQSLFYLMVSLADSQ